ncbi:hypothetical protein [Hansschlegelia zhihuaiae]|uniref:Uncharacterized protein n=1 Tax=Hansschlegelia zhihuaiae TaxID=405005 RepID=A0A4V1KIW6_9HYPH|nr:hypothetical protein [Hansschlegelia zhihuaiae]RXF72122.1 hypothetical protein EK403_15035 [Hansschlegelia zhihuaiae]
MLRLRTSVGRTPERLDLDGNAWVEVRCASLADYHAAVAHGAAVAQAIEEGGLALETLGLALPDSVSGRTAHAAIRDWAFHLEIGAACVVAWGGIGDQEGVALAEPTPETVKLLMADPAVSGRIVRAALRRVHEVFDEGEGSAVSPTGGRGTASPTAAPAATKASPAPSSDGLRTAGDAPSASSRQ